MAASLSIENVPDHLADLSTYDAAHLHLHLARALDAELVTLDVRLERAWRGGA